MAIPLPLGRNQSDRHPTDGNIPQPKGIFSSKLTPPHEASIEPEASSFPIVDDDSSDDDWESHEERPDNEAQSKIGDLPPSFASRKSQKPKITKKTIEGSPSGLGPCATILEGTVTDVASSHRPSFNMDQVTLECMMNKNLYKKYLARTDTDKYQQTQVQSRRLANAREPVLDITRQLISDYVRHGNSKLFTHKIHSAFEEYIDLCMTYIAEHPPVDENDDIDVLFDPRRMKG
jgi:hypothetical protein